MGRKPEGWLVNLKRPSRRRFACLPGNGLSHLAAARLLARLRQDG